MKSLLLAALCLASADAAENHPVNIVPRPKWVQPLDGHFLLNADTKLVAADALSRRSAEILNECLRQELGFALEFAPDGKSPDENVILFQRGDAVEDSAAGENYALVISPQKIRIVGGEAGQFYAIQSLRQLLPREAGATRTAKIPAVEILDEPRFRYRGMHLDVSRHFMPVAFVKKFIDLMAQYKFNQFHWHLTDDQGWRIEIKKYPRLTEIGSTRPESHAGKYSPEFKGDGVPVEGFYTQEEIREVVAYAKARQINIIPEIEMPGHASAALAAYPELGAAGPANHDYRVQRTWGIFKEVFFPTEATFHFLEEVLAETCALFPDSPYIHIGGDEVLPDFWQESPFVQELMRKENLKDAHAVQGYFIRRIEKFVNAQGKRIVGWDEILEGGAAPGAVVMSWRGEKGGIAAAKAGHEVIMTPNVFLYFDYSQSESPHEPLNIGGFVPLEKVYSYNPVPAELSAAEARFILGAQANLWSEYMPTPAAVEYMAFPRMIALAEVNWSPLDAKDYPVFLRRLSHHYARLDAQAVNYRIPEPQGLTNVAVDQSGRTTFSLQPLIADAKMFYTLDGSDPTPRSTPYTGPFEVRLPADGAAVEVKVIVVNARGRSSSLYSAKVARPAPAAAAP